MQTTDQNKSLLRSLVDLEKELKTNLNKDTANIELDLIEEKINIKILKKQSDDSETVAGVEAVRYFIQSVLEYKNWKYKGLKLEVIGTDYLLVSEEK